MIQCFNAVIYGHVQGVGFRYFSKIKADQYKIRGWVHNLPDQTVEIMAVGDSLALEQFMQCLKKGCVGSKVEKVDFHFLEDFKKSEGFEIKA